MAEREQPLLRLGAPKSFPRKKRKPSFPPPPPRNFPSHARSLSSGAEQVKLHLEEAERRFPTLATDVPYVRVQVAEGAVLSDDELKSLNLIVVHRREDAVLAAYATERELSRLGTQISSYAKQTKKLAVLSKIEGIQPWTREDRISTRIADVELESDRDYVVDMLLLPIEGHSSNPQSIPSITSFLQQRNGAVLDRVISPEFTALRVKAGGQTLDDLLEFRDDIAYVDFPPPATVLVPDVLQLDLEEVPQSDPPAATAPAICIVDSGIVEGHPLLGGAVLSDWSKSFPSDLGPPIPAPPVREARHGTTVAGIALFGDVGACVTKKKFPARFWLINARLLDDDNRLSVERMPFLRDIVDHVQDRCRILNLSIGLWQSEGYLSIWAAEIDQLVREKDILFILSSGNSIPDDTSKLDETSYPGFLFELGNVRSPAEALNALTVGGITPDRDPYPPQKGLTAVAPRRAPSPFSAHTGLKNVVKPELVEEAGNVGYDSSLKRWVMNNPGLRVPTTGHDFAAGKLLTFMHGTSYSAPRVAHIAAHLVERYPEATPNLLRALLVQSARPPAGVADWRALDVMRVVGFGVPDLARALYCAPARVTLYYEGTIKPDEVQIFDVPVPDELNAAKGKKRVTVTVAYDPPVSVVHRDRPVGINLTWQVARGDTPEKVLHQAIVADAEAASVTSAPKGKKKSAFWKGTLPRRRQQRGTVQKDVFEWTRGAHGNMCRLAITAKAVRPRHADDEQRFAVVVTLEAASEEVNIYQAIRTRLAAGRVRVRVPAR